MIIHVNNDHYSDYVRHDDFVLQASGPGQAQYRREGPLQGSFNTILTFAISCSQYPEQFLHI